MSRSRGWNKCLALDCGKRASVRGWCPRHWNRIRKGVLCEFPRVETPYPIKYPDYRRVAR